jgi:1-acyl-sn-glycerol-3-phosphate acyltransferase
MKYFLGGIRLVLLVIFSSLTHLCYSTYILFSKHTNQKGYKLRKFYLSVILPLMGIRVQKKGLVNTKPALYVCNHRGLLDFTITLNYVEAFILSKAEVRKYPILGKGSGYTGVFWVDRGDKNSRGSARQAIIEILKSGENVFIFPEGTTHYERTSMDFKIGSFEEVVKEGFAVVPVALEYKTGRDYWKNMNMVQMYFSQFGKLFTRCKLHYGPALHGYNNAEKLCSDARKWIDDELISMQKDWSEVWTES